MTWLRLSVHHLSFFIIVLFYLTAFARWPCCKCYGCAGSLLCLPWSSQPSSSMRSVQALRQTTGMMRMYWATIGTSKRFVFVRSLSMLPTKTCSKQTQVSKLNKQSQQEHSESTTNSHQRARAILKLFYDVFVTTWWCQPVMASRCVL